MRNEGQQFINGVLSEWIGKYGDGSGMEAMRTLLVEQWRLTDGMLVERFRREQTGATLADGYDVLKVARCLGIVHLPRQVRY